MDGHICFLLQWVTAAKQDIWELLICLQATADQDSTWTLQSWKSSTVRANRQKSDTCTPAHTSWSSTMPTGRCLVCMCTATCSWSAKTLRTGYTHCHVHTSCIPHRLQVLNLPQPLSQAALLCPSHPIPSSCISEALLRVSPAAAAPALGPHFSKGPCTFPSGVGVLRLKHPSFLQVCFVH